jgi:hypothetical protein
MKRKGYDAVKVRGWSGPLSLKPPDGCSTEGDPTAANAPYGIEFNVFISILMEGPCLPQKQKRSAADN